MTVAPVNLFLVTLFHLRVNWLSLHDNPLFGDLMKIVTWNCNGAFRRKYDRVAGLNADIYVIQECEDPARSRSGPYKDWAGAYVWEGKTASKGVGVFVKNGLSVVGLNWPHHGLQQFLPVKIADCLNLLAVWTKNDANMGYIGQFWRYLQHHSPLLTRETIICGDFNSNSIWDKKGRVWNHSECVRALEQLGFDSLYHRTTGERQGDESRPTFCLYRNIAKPFHIDYIFAHRESVSGARHASVGLADEWLSISDHIPVVGELQGFAFSSLK